MDSFFDLRADNHGNDHFYEICRNKWNHTYSKCSTNRIISTDAEPCGSKSITYDCADNHAEQLHPALVTFVNYQSGDDCHGNKADDVATGRFVKEIGTGPIGMDRGARIQVTAVISAVTVIS